jgi:protein O-GlcNAc transferase
MDYQRFVQSLPSLYIDWGQRSVRPRSDQFRRLLTHVRGMTTDNVLQLLNFAVAGLEGEEIYCEVGCFQGATLMGALLGHPNCLAYAVDNFSEFDPLGDNERVLLNNLTAYGLQRQVRFQNLAFEQFFLGLRRTQARIGVYFYDGAHEYRSQLLGLLLAAPVLAERALIVVDDSNCASVKQASRDFLAVRSECRLLLDLPTLRNGDCTFWNGLHVLGWDANSS